MTPSSARATASPRDRVPSLRGRLLRLVGVLAIALIAVCAFATAGLTRLGGAVGRILKENYVSVIACEEMNEALERQDSAAFFGAVGHSEMSAPLLSTHRPGFEAAYAKEAANITLEGEGALVAEVRDLYRDYVSSVDRVLGGAPELRVERYFSELLPRLRALKDTVTAIRLLNQANMESTDEEARRVAQRTLEIAIGASLAALVLVAWLARRLSATILGPLATFTDRARAIGEGKLDTEIPLPAVNELRTLADALRRMQDKLRAYRESSLGELLAAKDLSRATVASMDEPVLVFGGDGELLLSNEAAEAIFGLRPGDADELRQLGIDVPDRIALARDAVLSRGHATSPSSLADAMRWVTATGERYFLVRASPLRMDDTGARGAIVLAQDVTRFRRIDALKSDVVATVSHELKTPLTSLRLATHMLFDEPEDALTELQRELVCTARDETERLQSTVNELLDLVRIEREAGALHRSDVRPRLLLDEVASAIRRIAVQRRITLLVEVEDDAAVSIDAEQMAIVLGNLSSNAVRHSPEGSKVWLRADHVGDSVVFSVRDEGEGIAAEHLPRIFDRHWSGAEPATLKGRHGLGLAIAKEIVTRHAGTIEVDSAPGRGTLFRIRLPRAPAPLEAGDDDRAQLS